MKHYFIHHKGNDTEKLVKTPLAQRGTIKYYRYHEDCIEVIEIEPGDEGVTEEDIRRFYAAEDHEVYENIKARRPQRTAEEKAKIAAWKADYIRKFKAAHGYEPHPVDVDEAVKEAFPKNWTASLDKILDGDDYSGDKSAVLSKVYRSSGSAPGIVEKMDEIVSTWPDSWREIYERVLKNGETIVSVARERGVTEGAVRKTLNKIRKTLAENPDLKKFVRFFD